MKRTCECGCGSRFEGRPDKRYASEACSKRARRAAAASGPSEGGSADGNPDGSTAARVRADLEAVGRLDSWIGAAALTLAAQIDAAATATSAAQGIKELRATMAEAMRGVKQTQSAVDQRKDEVAARRERRASGA